MMINSELPAPEQSPSELPEQSPLPPSEPSKGPRQRRSVLFIIGGLLLFIPALLLLFSTLVQPTLQTLSFSQSAVKALGNTPPTYIGMKNFEFLASDRAYQSATEFTLMIIGVRLLAVSIAPLILALLLNEFRVLIRIPVRLLFTIPLAFFFPAIALLGWRLALNPEFGIYGHDSVLGNPDTARSTLLAIDGLFTFAFACGVGSVIYLIALRGTGTATDATTSTTAPRLGQVALPLFVTWLVMVATAIATALQEFNLSYLMTNGGPVNSTTTLALYQFRQNFMMMRFGVGAAISVNILVPVMILGTLVGLIVIVSQLRLQMVPIKKPVGFTSGTVKVLIGVLLVLAAIAAFWISISAILPVLWSWSATGLPGKPDMPESLSINNLWSNTVLPHLSAIVVIQLPIVYLAALGIGAFRPLGKYSEWLLLPFAPWLFVTVVPLGLSLYLNLREAEGLNTPAAYGIESVMLNVAVLFILTLFFKGQEHLWRKQGQGSLGSFLRVVILPSIPITLLLGLIMVGINQNDLYWSLIAVNSSANYNIPLFFAMINGQYATNLRLISTLLANFGQQFAVISFIVLAIFQLFFVDRLALGKDN